MNAFPHFVVASDSFKAVCTSLEAGNAIRSGIEEALHFHNIVGSVSVFPVADGGEGTAEALVSALNGGQKTIQVYDPFGCVIDAAYGDLGYQDNLRTAVLDMAAAAGFALIKSREPNLMTASTYGVGQMIHSLVNQGFQRILVGLGGSGTNDGGIGALQAMGAVFLDAYGNRLSGKDGAQILERIVSVDLSSVHKLLENVELHLLYDAAVPLTGTNGATQMFSRQKGATEEIMKRLENGMTQYASAILKSYPAIDYTTNGAGAAGGLGFGLYAAGGILCGGATYILDCLHFREAIENAAAVFTGEGKTDIQSAYGKLPAVVASQAARANVPCICLCGAAEPGKELYEQGMTAVFAIADKPLSLEDSIASTQKLLSKTAFNCTNLLLKNIL